jgi:hypothetical protein
MGEEINLAPPGMQTVPLLILQKPCTEFKGLTPIFSSSAAVRPLGISAES